MNHCAECKKKTYNLTGHPFLIGPQVCEICFDCLLLEEDESDAFLNDTSRAILGDIDPSWGDF